jgi:mercuric ion binding protein
MKTLKIFSLIFLFMAFVFVSFGQQTKTETIPVSGNCGMCKTTIEKAAKKAGATSADWNVDSKNLTVKYNSSTTNAAKIQQSIATVGYDTRDFKATDGSYNKLHACCQYARDMAKTEKNCCSDKCEMSAGSGGKDGKCKDETACKEKGCCKDSEKCKEMGCCTMEKTSAQTSHSH